LLSEGFASITPPPEYSHGTAVDYSPHFLMQMQMAFVAIVAHTLRVLKKQRVDKYLAWS
jgi:hypothetical protein